MKSVWIFILLTAFCPPVYADGYDDAVDEVASARSDVDDDERRATLQAGFDTLTKFWLGTRWGLGAPQSDTPGEGKINCGTFVGTVLDHLGFELDVKKLQRQPAELIIKTFTPRSDIIRFRNRPVDEFVDRVRAAGDGVYIIGLDFHVGFLRVRNGEVRFVHASYVTHTVVDELAVKAEPIVTSKYRVVGKIFDDEMLDTWTQGDEIDVVGNW